MTGYEEQDGAWQDVARLIKVGSVAENWHLFAYGHFDPVLFLAAADEYVRHRYGPGFDYLFPSHNGGQAVHEWYRPHPVTGQYMRCGPDDAGAEPYTRIEQD